MENALSPLDSTGHSGNVALFIPRSMRGCYRRRHRILLESAKERRGGPAEREAGEEVKRGGERRKVGGWDGRAPSCTPFHGASASPPSRPSFLSSL